MPPDRLDLSTGDPYRRSLRIVCRRLTDEVVFPYDGLDADDRAGWLQACLNDGEIREPKAIYAYDEGSIAASERSTPSRSLVDYIIKI